MRVKHKLSRSYIIYKGKKIYLNDTYWSLRYQLNRKDETNGKVKFIVSRLIFDKKEVFDAQYISGYGEVKREN